MSVKGKSMQKDVAVEGPYGSERWRWEFPYLSESGTHSAEDYLSTAQKPKSPWDCSFFFFSSLLVLFEIEIVKNNKTLCIGKSSSHLFCGKSVMGLP